MKIVIVGAGLGGLACAIACRRTNLDVLVLEQSREIIAVGAGIQIPPNGARIMRELGLLAEIEARGLAVERIEMRRYSDGRVITSMPCGETVVREYGAPWIVIHRADYQQILLDRARSLGAMIRLDAAVERVDIDTSTVVLRNGDIITGDVIVGADGLWSRVRNSVLDNPLVPQETGDLAYRATFTRAQLHALADDAVTALCSKRGVTGWLGPGKHAVFYPVRGGDEYNLVLLQADDLAPGVRTTQGNVQEMQDAYQGWDPVLRKMIACIPAVLKWKLCHLAELPRWSKGCFTLLGDACHPTLPYQAQGAAMAVEDGAVLGRLLGHIASDPSRVSSVLRLYEDLRKPRTTHNVQGAIRNRSAFHLSDGILQKLRDLALGVSGLTRETDWIGLMAARQRAVLGVDVLEEVERGIRDLSHS